MTLPFGKVINVLGEYTFGIYLTHWYIMDAVSHYLLKIFKIDHYSMIYRLGSPFIIIPIAVFVVYVLRKIPIVKNIVP